jgi:hypothetical protein
MKLKYRFPYSDENGLCHDCGVLPGQWHHDGCDVEKCPFTEFQRLICDCGGCGKLGLTEKIPFGFEETTVREMAIKGDKITNLKEEK